MEHISTLWSDFPVKLETKVDDHNVTCIYANREFRVEGMEEENSALLFNIKSL